MDAHSPNYQAVIDQALDLMYSHHHRLAKQLAPQTFVELTIEDLRSGPLGRDLQKLADLARGVSREQKDTFCAPSNLWSSSFFGQRLPMSTRFLAHSGIQSWAG